MSIDIGQLFGNAEDSVKHGMTDLLHMGGNAGLGFLEGKAISILQQDQADKNSAAQQQIQTTLDQPNAPGSFGAYLSNLAQTPVLKEYGPYILAGIGGIILVTLIARNA